MSKLKQWTVGSILKPPKDKNGTNSDSFKKMDYIRLKGDKQTQAFLLTAIQNMDENGLLLRLETRETQLAKLDYNLSQGTLTEDYVIKQKERVNNLPEFVRFEIVLPNP